MGMFSGIENRTFSESGQGTREKIKRQIATEFTEGTATQEIIYKKTRTNKKQKNILTEDLFELPHLLFFVLVKKRKLN